ncbi:LysM domain protein [compost metagenome]
MDYFIKPGDTLGKLATRFGSSVRKLVALNGVQDPNRIIAGLTLKVGGDTNQVQGGAGRFAAYQGMAGAGRTSSQGPIPAAEAALAWQQSQLEAGNSYENYCLRFVRLAFEQAGTPIPGLTGKGSAANAMAGYEAAGRLNPMDPNEPPPKGAIVFWPATESNGGYGHIAISNGDGTCSTSGWPGFGGDPRAAISWLNGAEGVSTAGWAIP